MKNSGHAIPWPQFWHYWLLMSHHTAAYFPPQCRGFVCQFVRLCHWDVPVLADPCSKPRTVTCPPRAVLEHLPALHLSHTQFIYCDVFPRSCQMMSTEKGHSGCQSLFLKWLHTLHVPQYFYCGTSYTSKQTLEIIHLQENNSSSFFKVHRFPNTPLDMLLPKCIFRVNASFPEMPVRGRCALFQHISWPYVLAKVFFQVHRNLRISLGKSWKFGS